MQHLSVQPTLQDVARAGEALRALLPPALQGPERDAVEIAVVEVLTNIVQHGFVRQAPAPIELSCDCTGEWLAVEVRDAGEPIPAGRMDSAGPDTFDFDPDDIAALPENGMGLAILKSAFDRIAYTTGEGMNCLRLEKRIA
ncbi:MAG TPA: ATP-binding protein [Ramlibacter sp.]|nr:ATP-binding protein [Ramlibacter sp.]